jgi:hypothetical protein
MENPREYYDSHADVAMPMFDWDDFSKPLLDGISMYDGKLVSIPFDIPIFILMYRRDLYEKLGLKVPTDLNEYMANVKAIQAAESKNGIYGTTGQLRSGHYSLNCDWTAWLWGNGGSVYDKAGMFAGGDEAGIKGLEYMAEIAKNCPKCTIKSVTIQPTSLGKDAAQIISNFLRKNPDIKHLFLSYDLEASGLPAAVKGVGGTMPKTYSWGIEAPGLTDLNKGVREGAAVPDLFNESSWQMVDGLARVFAGADIKDSYEFQQHIIWSKDLGNLPKPPFDPFPSAIPDYKEQFKKLWGVA